MPQEIQKGFIVEESSERIISKAAELSADPSKISIKLTFKSVSGVPSVPHLKIKFPGSAAVDYELDGKIPPSTGFNVVRKKKK